MSDDEIKKYYRPGARQKKWSQRRLKKWINRPYINHYLLPINDNLYPIITNFKNMMSGLTVIDIKEKL